MNWLKRFFQPQEDYLKHDYMKHTERIIQNVKLRGALFEARDLIAHAAENGSFSEEWNERTFQFYKSSGSLLGDTVSEVETS